MKKQKEKIQWQCNVSISATKVYRVAQKVSHCQVIKNRIESYYSQSVRLDFFVKIKYESSTTILFVGIRYSMHDLLCDLSNYA